ncbi:MAG TPA: MinD/ParA family protein [Candidatus Cybelea sp.]|nr:MinD/ParA family protein [Candidatus Cybelea sp.]
MTKIGTLSAAHAGDMNSPAGKRDAKIVCVASGKGGVGKTWLAITLTHSLARRGRRTLLFDGDLGLANVDVQLGLTPDRDLGSVVAGQLRLSDVVLSFAGGGFDVIAGRSGSGSLASLEAKRLTGLRADLIDLAQRYDHVVLDLGAGVDGPVQALAGAASTVLVVTTDEPTALTDAYAFIKLSALHKRETDFRVAVNMAASARDGERTFAKLLRACEGFLKLSPKLAGIIRRDDKVRDSIRHQTLLLARHPTSSAAADVETLTARLALDG